MTEIGASLTVHFGGGPAKVDFSIGVGPPQMFTAEHVVLGAVQQAGAQMLETLTQPEMDQIKQLVADRLNEAKAP